MSNRIPQYLSLLLILIISNLLQGQASFVSSLNQTPKFQHFTLEDGLSQASIHDILQDKQGFLWLATQDGLNRFDGHSFMPFREKDGDIHSVSGNFIQAIVEDSSGHIWVGSQSGGVSFFDQTTQHFYRIDVLAKEAVNALALLPDGRILVGLDKRGLAIIIPDYDQGASVVFLESLPNSISIKEVHVTQDGAVWLGTQTGDLYFSTRNDPFRFRKISIPEKEIILDINSTKDRIWIGTRKHLWAYSLDSQEFRTIDVLSSNPHWMVYGETESSENGFYDIYFSRDGDVWVGTGDGLFRWHVQSRKASVEITGYLMNKRNPNSLQSNSVYKIWEDRDGQIWVGTARFLSLLSDKSFFTGLHSVLGEENSLSSNIIFSIFKSSDTLWVGTSEGGLNRLTKNKVKVFTESDGLGSNFIFSQIKDQDGNYWIGTSRGISILPAGEINQDDVHFIQIKHDESDVHSLSNDFIRQIYQDQSGNIWVCTFNGGLNRFVGNLQAGDYRFVNYSEDEDKENTLLSERVYCITQVQNGEYWVGTARGVNVLSFSDKGLEQPHFSCLSEDFGRKAVYDIIEDKQENIWIGSISGLRKLDPLTGKMTVLKEQDGLPNNTIYALAEDGLGSIWVSTNKGISCYHVAKNKFDNYSKSDGLLGNEFDVGAKWKDEHDAIYFGGLNGLNVFCPKELSDLGQIYPMVFYSIRKTNPKANTFVIENIVQGQTVVICQWEFPFYIEFSDVNLCMNEPVEFAYRLDKNRRWNRIGASRKIPFLKLSPGAYHLEVQGITRGEIWTGQPLSLTIVIKPPILLRWWAYLIYALIIGLGIYGFYRYQLDKKLAINEAERLKELDSLKSKLYTNITHEFRTPLTVVLGMVDELLGQMGSFERERYLMHLQLIKKNSNSVLQLVNQMLDLSKVESGRLQLNYIKADVVEYLRVINESFHSLAKIKDISVVFLSKLEQLVMDYDPDKLQMVFSNLITNAIKFTPSKGQVFVTINQLASDQQKYLEISIRDTGVGIPDDELPFIFDRFYQGNNAQKTHVEGTGIGLALTKEIVRLCGGSIRVASEGVGTEFILILPIHCSAQAESNKVHVNKKDAMVILNPDPLPLKEDTIVLIVEDNDDVAQYIAMCLGDSYHIQKAKDGQEGVKKALEIIPDIIITDLMMPELDGYGLCQQLKSNELTAHIPIMMLTARSLKEDKIQGYSVGADAFLVKPFNRKELLVRFEQLLKLRQTLLTKYQSMSILPIESTDKLDTIFLNKIVASIQNHLGQPDFKSAQLAKNLGFSESQLYRKLKALTNQSTAIFIRKVRLEESKKLILCTNLNISEVAYDCGFTDAAWFSRVFKEEYGVSPSMYRHKKL